MKSLKNKEEIEKSVAKTYGSLCFTFLGTALLTYKVSGEGWWIPLMILGVLSGLFSILVLVKVLRWKREQIIKHASSLHIENIAWFLAITVLGIGSLQLGFAWSRVVGLVLVGVAYFVLGSGIGLNIRSMRRIGDMNMSKEEKMKEKMKEMLRPVPNMEELGFDYDKGGGWQIFTAVYYLDEHSQRLNRLTLTLICLTVILLVATITDIIVRVT